MGDLQPSSQLVNWLSDKLNANVLMTLREANPHRLQTAVIRPSSTLCCSVASCVQQATSIQAKLAHMQLLCFTHDQLR